MHHIDLGCIVVPLGRKGPSLEFFRLPIESRDPALIHRGQPDVPLLVELQPEVARRKAWLQDRDGKFSDLCRPGIESSDILLAKIRIPNDSLRVHDHVVRLDHGARKVVLRDDDLSVLPLGSRERLERIRPGRGGAQIDRAEELREPLLRLPQCLSAGRHQPAGRSFLHVQRKTRIRIRRHPLQHGHEFSRIVSGFDDAFERVADDAREQAGLLIVGTGHAHQPLRVRELGGQILRVAQGQIAGDGLARRNLDDSGIVHFVSDGADAERILTGGQSVPRKAVLAPGIAQDADAHGGSRLLRADDHALHEPFGC